MWSPGAVKQNACIISNSSDISFFYLKFSSPNLLSWKLIQFIFQNLFHFFKTKLEIVQISSSNNNNNNNKKNNSRTPPPTTTTTMIVVVNCVIFDCLSRRPEGLSEKRMLWLWREAARKQHLVYYNSWDCWYFTLLVLFCVLHCLDFGSTYWR